MTQTIDPNDLLKEVLPTALIQKLKILPFKQTGDTISCYSVQEKNDEHRKAEKILKKIFDLRVVDSSDFTPAFLHFFDRKGSDSQMQNKKIDFSNYAEYIPQLLSEAQQIGSSDIHIEIYKEHYRIRMRMNGRLYTRYKLTEDEYFPLVNKIKIESQLDIAERRLPQDGRIHFVNQQFDFDIRVSTLPTLYGEKIVLRLLVKNDAVVQLDKVGMDSEQLLVFRENISHHNGILLISGPTGSGKTTTLYATLKQLNEESSNILTIEDPIEYTLDGVNQVQLKKEIGLDFSTALRTFLRQDPDIIMVGEIRDVQTANMAIRAALTGHLVLSTIHTNSAQGTIGRLVDMGVPDYLLASTLRLSLAQRLVALLCTSCKEQIDFDASLYPRGFKPPSSVENQFIAKGCSKCNYTGIERRKAIFELLEINEEVAYSIKHNQKIAVTYQTLSDKAFELFAQGLASFEEIFPHLLRH